MLAKKYKIRINIFCINTNTPTEQGIVVNNYLYIYCVNILVYHITFKTPTYHILIGGIMNINKIIKTITRWLLTWHIC